VCGSITAVNPNHTMRAIATNTAAGQEDMRVSVPMKNVEKFRRVFLYILNKVGAKPNVGETVLFKLLYSIDFDCCGINEKQLMKSGCLKYPTTPRGKSSSAWT